MERATKDLKARDRVRFIGLLKIGKATTQAQAGALVGLQVRRSRVMELSKQAQKPEKQPLALFGLLNRLCMEKAVKIFGGVARCMDK